MLSVSSISHLDEHVWDGRDPNEDGFGIMFHNVSVDQVYGSSGTSANFRPIPGVKKRNSYLVWYGLAEVISLWFGMG